LYGLLAAIDPKAELFEREARLVDLSHWVRRGGEVPALWAEASGEPPALRRLRFLCHSLWLFGSFRARLSKLLRAVLGELTGQALFARLGIPGDSGLFSETIDRLSRRLLPQPIDEQDLIQLVERLFPKHADWAWLARVPPSLLVNLIELTRTPEFIAAPTPLSSRQLSAADLALGELPSLPDPRASLPSSSRVASAYLPLRVAVLEATLLLASRVSAAGLSDVIRSRTDLKTLQESPFFRLPRVIDALLATPRREAEEIASWVEHVRELVTSCRLTQQEVQSRLEAAGVSVDVVYRLELIERSLNRLELLLSVLVPQASEELAARSVGTLMRLLDDRRRDLSLLDIVRTNTHMLARKIIERAGQTGEHYITISKGEFAKMFLAASGGGLLAAGTNVVKLAVGHLHRPLLQEGLLISANYAGSFILMQLAGFTLATKQPSMTAAALAFALSDKTADSSELVTTVARLVRSQIAAAAGNILLVIPASLALDWLWTEQSAGGEHVLTADYAHKTIASLHPTQSGTLGFAVVTAVILWLSSLAAGWVENWAVYRRLPEAIEEHRWRRLFGRRLMRGAGRFVGRNIGGIGGNLAIGLMLGFTPILGEFVGLNVEIRHITISTSSLTFALRALGVSVLSTSEFHSALLGLLGILSLNLVVSFGLALGVAMRARDVSFLQALKLLFHVVYGFFRSPLRFFLPVGEKSTESRAHS
jgi:site-specific recombinase